MSVAASGDRLPVCAEAQDPRTLLELKKKRRFLNDDLNNVAAMRVVVKPSRDPNFAYRSLGIPPADDDILIRSKYRPFLLPDEVQEHDWISTLELATATALSHRDIELTGERLRVLVLYGSLRQR